MVFLSLQELVIEIRDFRLNNNVHCVDKRERVLKAFICIHLKNYDASYKFYDVVLSANISALFASVTMGVYFRKLFAGRTRDILLACFNGSNVRSVKCRGGSQEVRHPFACPSLRLDQRFSNRPYQIIYCVWHMIVLLIASKPFDCIQSIIN